MAPGNVQSEDSSAGKGRSQIQSRAFKEKKKNAKMEKLKFRLTKSYVYLYPTLNEEARRFKVRLRGKKSHFLGPMSLAHVATRVQVSMRDTCLFET